MGIILVSLPFSKPLPIERGQGCKDIAFPLSDGKGKPYGNTNVSLSPGRRKEEIMTIHIAIRKDRCLFSQLFEPVSQVLCLQEAFADAMFLIPQALRGERVLCLQLAGRKPRRMERKSAFWFSLR